MLLTCFNCDTCKKPFDCKEGMPNTPVLGDPAKVTNCAACETVNPEQVPYRGLLQFLDQPAFEKTDDGYVCEEIHKIPPGLTCICRPASEDVYVSGAYKLQCGHLLCCHSKSMVKCRYCGAIDESKEFYRDQGILALLEERRKELGLLGIQSCADCYREGKIERLFRCEKCRSALCGFCAYKKHRYHHAVDLLGIELGLLQDGSIKRFDEAVSGLEGNFGYLHLEANKAVESLKGIGIQRLQQIPTFAEFSDARKVAAEIVAAAREFEEYCEEYIPAVRIFTEKIRQLHEKLNKSLGK
ncbi:unnamed protein product, partial [Mesorhabditis spiculigera]